MTYRIKSYIWDVPHKRCGRASVIYHNGYWGVFMSEDNNQDDYIIALKHTNDLIDELIESDLDAALQLLQLEVYII